MHLSRTWGHAMLVIGVDVDADDDDADARAQARPPVGEIVGDDDDWKGRFLCGSEDQIFGTRKSQNINGSVLG